MPSFSPDLSWADYILWNLLSFSLGIMLNSFVEWGAHRFVLHSKRFVRFAYELHHVNHHGLFRADETFTAEPQDARREHVRFVWKDYFLFLLVTTPVWIAAELLAQQPFLVGGVAATLLGLQAFNSLHWRFHCPSDTFFQRTRFFRYLKEHHRRHHEDTSKNLNVYFFPLADWVLGTLYKNPGK